MVEQSSTLASLSAPVPEARLGHGETAALLAEALARGDVLHAAGDEPAAAAIARALTAATPDAVVVLCPSSDALPGDDAPASPANVGQRVAALRTLRLTLALAERPPVAFITTGEALGRVYPPPASFDAAPPLVAIGRTIDLAALADELEALGYVADERVDEPGEIALRGLVLDVFPADAAEPIRIEADNGRVAAIRTYDPADQLTTGTVERRELGRVSEPDSGNDGVPLLDHLPGAVVSISIEAEDRRRRFLTLAGDAGRRRSRRAVSTVLEAGAWEAALGARKRLKLTSAGDPPPRFVEGGAPLRAFAREAKRALDAGDRVVLVGSERDLRFLRRRISSALKRECVEAGTWAAAVEADPGTLLSLTMPVDRGFRAKGLVAVAAADLLGSRAEREDAPSAAADAALSDLADIRIGDVVVHEDHGIALVAGLEVLSDDDGERDAIRLTYAGDAVRLVPVDEADRLWRYGADVDEIDSFEQELEDRFGAIPEQARILVAVARTRAQARAAGIAAINAGPAAIALLPRQDAVIDAAAHGLEGKGDRLLLRERHTDPVARLARIATLLTDLADA